MPKRPSRLFASLQLSHEGPQTLVPFCVSAQVIGVQPHPSITSPSDGEVRWLLRLADHLCITHRIPLRVNVAHHAAPVLNNDPVAGFDLRTY